MKICEVFFISIYQNHDKIEATCLIGLSIWQWLVGVAHVTYMKSEIFLLNYETVDRLIYNLINYTRQTQVYYNYTRQTRVYYNYTRQTQVYIDNKPKQQSICSKLN